MQRKQVAVRPLAWWPCLVWLFWVKIYEHPERAVEVRAVVGFGCEILTTFYLKELLLSMNKIPLSYGFARLLLSRGLSLQSSCHCLGKYKHYISVSVGLKNERGNFSKDAIFSSFLNVVILLLLAVFTRDVLHTKPNIVYEAMNTNHAFGIFVRSTKRREKFIRRKRNNSGCIFPLSNKCVCKNAMYFELKRISMYWVGDKITCTILLNLG